MAEKILEFKARGNIEPVLDSKGRRVPYFTRSRLSGKIFYRRELKKLGIPPIFVSTGETTIGRAKVQAEILLNRHKNKHLGIPDGQVYGRARKGIAITKVIDEFLERETPKQRPRTQVKHKFFMEAIREGLGHLDAGSVTEELADDWLRSVKRMGVRTTYSSFADYPKHFNRLMRYAHRRQYAGNLISVRNPLERSRPKFRVFTLKEICRMYDVADQRGKLQLTLAYENALRLREMLGLTTEQVNLTTGKLILRPHQVKTGSKTGRGRTIYLSENGLRLLKEWRETLPERAAFFFPSPTLENSPVDHNRGLWGQIKTKAKIKGSARWHDLRHTAISHMLLKRKLPIVDVSKFVGTSISEIEKTYLHENPNDLREVSAALRIDGEE